MSVGCHVCHVTGHVISHVIYIVDIKALWRAVSVEGMGEADISKYLQNGIPFLHSYLHVCIYCLFTMNVVGLTVMEGTVVRKRKVYTYICHHPSLSLSVCVCVCVCVCACVCVCVCVCMRPCQLQLSVPSR